MSRWKEVQVENGAYHVSRGPAQPSCDLPEECIARREYNNRRSEASMFPGGVAMFAYIACYARHTMLDGSAAWDGLRNGQYFEK